MKETKIFISHRSLDVDYATAVVDFLEDLGVSSNSIVCTSVPGHLIPNGQKIYEWLRSQFIEYNLHMLFLLSDNYYNSPDCLNEMGAVWAANNRVRYYILPNVDFKEIGWLCDAYKADKLCDPVVLDALAKELTDFYGLPPKGAIWSRQRQNFMDFLRGSI